MLIINNISSIIDNISPRGIGKTIPNIGNIKFIIFKAQNNISKIIFIIFLIFNLKFLDMIFL